MVFNIAEIKNYLKSQKNLESAISNLSTKSISLYNFSSRYEHTDENLKKYEEFIGLKRLIQKKKSTKQWTSLNPHWIKNKEQKEKERTKYDIMYWVNYGDDNTYGWFTVEQIKKWLMIPKLKLHTLGGTKER